MVFQGGDPVGGARLLLEAALFDERGVGLGTDPYRWTGLDCEREPVGPSFSVATGRRFVVVFEGG